MKIWLVAVVLLAATSAGAAPKKADKEAATKPTVDPNLAVAKVHGGKVWVATDSIPAIEGAELDKWLAAHPANAQLTCKSNEDRWVINFLAVFKKPPAKGPITVMLVDKKEPNIIVDQFSPQTPGAALVYQEGYDLEQNNGFNKGHTYLIKVGQLIKGKFQLYATGDIILK
ncbi:MAG TPA: hypothetical protein VJ860_09915 [Polyangia bacterium]|nr:hypothetical protein [Polyangia bacterium]